MTKSATREKADKVTFTQAEVNSAVALKAPIASPVFTGNVGVGVTPEASSSGHTSLAVGGNQRFETNTVKDGGNYGSWMQNAHYEGSWKYISTGATSRMYQGAGTLAMQVAPSGTADAAISWNTAMSIDNAGIVTKPFQPAFGVGRGGGNVATSNDYVWDTVRFNIGSHYNPANGKFTAPVDGRYHFNVNLMSQDLTYNNKYWQIMLNGSEYQRVYSTNGGSYHHRWNWNGTLELSANDYIVVHTHTVGMYGGSAIYNHFSGYLLG